MIVTPGKIYDRCRYCGSLVRMNKPLIGSLHVCLTPDERAQIDERGAFWSQERNRHYIGDLAQGQENPGASG